MGQWLEDPNEPSGWRYDPDAPDGDPTVTHILPEVTPTQQDEPERDDLGGHLGTVTDQEWRDAHERLIADMPELADQLTYTWAPDVDGRSLIDYDEHDIAPGPDRYDPATDERFHGGGFRG